MIKLLNTIKDFFTNYKTLIKTIITLFIILCLITFGFIVVKKINDFFSNKYSEEKKTLIADNKKLLEEKEKNLIELNKQLSERDKQIKKLKDQIPSSYTSNELDKINCDIKNKIILDQQGNIVELNKIIDSDTKLLDQAKKDIEELNKTLKETNEKYAKSPDPKKNSLKLFVLGGLSVVNNSNGNLEFKPDLYCGLAYARNLFLSKLIDVDIEFGGAVKVYKDLGFGVELASVFGF